MSAKSHLGWPSFGFYTLFFVHMSLVGLLVWGWQRPSLDAAFELMARRELEGPVEYSQNDVNLLQRVWVAHSSFGRALLGKGSARFLEPTESGWLARSLAHLAIRPEAAGATAITVEARGAPSDFPIKLRLVGGGFERQLELVSGQQQKVEIASSELSQPSILAVELAAAQGRSTTAPTWAVRLVQTSAANVRETP